MNANYIIVIIMIVLWIFFEIHLYYRRKFNEITVGLIEIQKHIQTLQESEIERLESEIAVERRLIDTRSKDE